jgi:hypothetical protein
VQLASGQRGGFHESEIELRDGFLRDLGGADRATVAQCEMAPSMIWLRLGVTSRCLRSRPRSQTMRRSPAAAIRYATTRLAHPRYLVDLHSSTGSTS